jgi:hypothetical protein
LIRQIRREIKIDVNPGTEYSKVTEESSTDGEFNCLLGVK